MAVARTTTALLMSSASVPPLAMTTTRIVLSSNSGLSAPWRRPIQPRALPPQSFVSQPRSEPPLSSPLLSTHVFFPLHIPSVLSPSTLLRSLFPPSPFPSGLPPIRLHSFPRGKQSQILMPTSFMAKMASFLLPPLRFFVFDIMGRFGGSLHRQVDCMRPLRLLVLHCTRTSTIMKPVVRRPQARSSSSLLSCLGRIPENPFTHFIISPSLRRRTDRGDDDVDERNSLCSRARKRASEGASASGDS